MSNMENFQCPFSQSECVTYACMMYDKRLNNCSIPVLALNIFKLMKTIEPIVEAQKSKHPFPFPPQRKN